MTAKTRRQSVPWAALVTAGLVACGPGGPSPDPGPATTAAAGGASAPPNPGMPHPTSLAPAGSAEPTGGTPGQAATTPGSNTPSVERASVTLEGSNADAPGALLPLVVTARGVTSTDTVTFTVAMGSSPATCEGQQWRHGQGVSQSCWVTLPSQAGSYNVTADADVFGPAAQPRRASTGTYAVTATGPVTRPPQHADRDRITTCGNTTDRVWLTFDDGFLSTADMHAVLDTLTRENAKGRFFGVGEWARAHPQMVAEIRRQGHAVHNHTSGHKMLHTLNDADLRAHIAEGPQPDSPPLLRPGYGVGAYTERVLTAARSQGHQVCYWTVDPRDWAKPTAQQIIDRVMTGDHKTPPVRAGGVVLLHMTGAHTAQALPGLLAAIRGRGLTVDPLR